LYINPLHFLYGTTASSGVSNGVRGLEPTVGQLFFFQVLGCTYKLHKPC